MEISEQLFWNRLVHIAGYLLLKELPVPCEVSQRGYSGWMTINLVKPVLKPYFTHYFICARCWPPLNGGELRRPCKPSGSNLNILKDRGILPFQLKFALETSGLYDLLISLLSPSTAGDGDVTETMCQTWCNETNVPPFSSTWCDKQCNGPMAQVRPTNFILHGTLPNAHQQTSRSSS